MKYQKSSPVTKAVAMAKLNSAILDQQIKIFMMDENEQCDDTIQDIGMTLSVIGYAAELQKIDCLDLRKLKGGWSACNQLASSGKYNKVQTIAISQALESAKRITPQLLSKNIDQALAITTRNKNVTQNQKAA